MSKQIKDLADRLGIKFNDISLLKVATTHRSFLNENRHIKEHNERLEFLGDAVLELAVTKFLYLNHKDDEGVLTNWRAALVRTESLADAAKAFDVGAYLDMSNGESRSGGGHKMANLANAMEAVLGAIYLDQGYEVVETFILEHICSKLDNIIANKSHIDAKSALQEMSQAKLGITPEYQIVSTSGPDHDKIFIVNVSIGNIISDTGTGRSKREAEQDAATSAIEKVKLTHKPRRGYNSKE
jgi:ribonuclease-3